MKKLLIVLLAIGLTVGCLSGCGSKTVETAESVPETEKVTEEIAETTAAAQEQEKEEAVKDESVKQETLEIIKTGNINQISLFADFEDEEVTSAVITFNEKAVRISDSIGNSKYHQWTKFDNIEDNESSLTVFCYNKTVQEVYEGSYDDFSSRKKEKIEFTDLRELTVGDLTFLRYDAIYEGEVEKEYFILELDNGRILHNGRRNAYDGPTPLDEMLALVFVNVETGDGSHIYPDQAFAAKEIDGQIFMQFESGEAYCLDYAEQIAEVKVKNSVIRVSFADEKIDDVLSMDFYITQQFTSLEEYKNQRISIDDLNEDYREGQITVGDLDIPFVCENLNQNTNSIYGIWYVPLAEGYALRGEYRNYFEEGSVSIEEAFALLFNGEVPEIEAGVAEQEEPFETNYAPILYNDGNSVLEVTYNQSVVYIDDSFRNQPQDVLVVIYDNGEGNYRYLFKTDNENYASVDDFYQINVNDCKNMFSDAAATELREIPCGNISFYTFTMTYTDNRNAAITAPLYFAEIEPGVYIYIDLGDTIQSGEVNEIKLAADEQMLKETFLNVELY